MEEHHENDDPHEVDVGSDDFVLDPSIDHREFPPEEDSSPDNPEEKREINKEPIDPVDPESKREIGGAVTEETRDQPEEPSLQTMKNDNHHPLDVEYKSETVIETENQDEDNNGYFHGGSETVPLSDSEKAHEHEDDDKREPAPDRRSSRFEPMELDVGPKASKSMQSLSRRRASSAQSLEKLTNPWFDYSKNLVFGVIRFFTFFCTAIILTTLIGNYTNLELGCWDDGKLVYKTRSDGDFKFRLLDDDCADGEKQPLLIFYHLGNVFFVLLCVIVMIDSIAPGPWNRPSYAYYLRSFGVKFPTWNSDHVGINMVRLMAQLMVCCYGNCSLIDYNKLDQDDYFVYFDKILGDYDYTHLALFSIAVTTFLLCLIDNIFDLKLSIWWNAKTEDLVDTNEALTYEYLWAKYWREYAIQTTVDEEAHLLVRCCDRVFMAKNYVWCLTWTITWICTMCLTAFHMVDVYLGDNCDGTEYGKMIFVFGSQFIILLAVFAYLVHSRYWMNQLAGTDGRSWCLLVFIITMGYCAIEPKYGVDYGDFADAAEYFRLIIGFALVVTIVMGIINTLSHKLYFAKDLLDIPMFVWRCIIALPIHGGFMIFCVVVVLATIGQFPILSEGIVFKFQCKDGQSACVQTNIPNMKFDSIEQLLVIVIIPCITTLIMIFYTFVDRTVSLDVNGHITRFVPFHKFKFWWPAFFIVFALNISSYRALESLPDFIEDVIEFAWAQFGYPLDVNTSNGFEAAQVSHYFCIVGIICLWLFYTISFMTNWQTVKEHLALEKKEAAQTLVGWIIPLILSVVAFLYGLVVVYNDVTFNVVSTNGSGDRVTKRFDIPAGLKDLVVVGPVMTALMMVYATLASTVGNEHVSPISRKTVALVSTFFMLASAGFALFYLVLVDQIVNAGPVTMFRVYYGSSMKLFSAYAVTFVAILIVCVDETAEALPLYEFQKTDHEMVHQDDNQGGDEHHEEHHVAETEPKHEEEPPLI